MDDLQRRLEEAYASANSAGAMAMDVLTAAADAVVEAHLARISADFAARHSADAMRAAERLEKMIAATLDILDWEEGAAP